MFTWLDAGQGDKEAESGGDEEEGRKEAGEGRAVRKGSWHSHIAPHSRAQEVSMGGGSTEHCTTPAPSDSLPTLSSLLAVVCFHHFL